MIETNKFVERPLIRRMLLSHLDFRKVKKSFYLAGDHVVTHLLNGYSPSTLVLPFIQAGRNAIHSQERSTRTDTDFVISERMDFNTA